MKKPIRKCTFAVSSILLFWMTQANAVVLVSYEFTGGSALSNDADLLSTASDFSIANAGANALIDTGYDNVYARSDNTPSSLNTSFYFSFSIAPEGSALLNLTSLTFDVAYNHITGESGAHSANFVVRSSEDSFSANLGGPVNVPFTTVFGDGGFSSFGTIDLSGTGFQNLSEAMEFRIYVYDTSSSANKSARVDNLYLSGSSVTAAVPESALVGLIAAIACGCVIFFRRANVRSFFQLQKEA